MTKAGRILNVGDEIKHESGTLQIEKVDGRRILRVRFQPHENQTHKVRTLIPLVSALLTSLL